MGKQNVFLLDAMRFSFNFKISKYELQVLKERLSCGPHHLNLFIHLRLSQPIVRFIFLKMQLRNHLSLMFYILLISFTPATAFRGTPGAGFRVSEDYKFENQQNDFGRPETFLMRLFNAPTRSSWRLQKTSFYGAWYCWPFAFHLDFKKCIFWGEI